MDRGAWWSTVDGVANSRTRLSTNMRYYLYLKVKIHLLENAKGIFKRSSREILHLRGNFHVIKMKNKICQKIFISGLSNSKIRGLQKGWDRTGGWFWRASVGHPACHSPSEGQVCFNNHVNTTHLAPVEPCTDRAGHGSRSLPSKTYLTTRDGKLIRS